MTLTQKDRTILGIVVAAFFIAMAVLTYVADDDESVSDSDKKEVVERADSISKELQKEKEKTDDQNYVIRQPLDEDPFKKLDELIGMENVKEEVRALANYVKVQKQRADQGLKTPKLSYHLVFTGSPGTGKTTVAHIVATIYHNIGILKKGHTIETDRSGLVAEYVGQTAIKTNKIIDAALNGVLFIDEAYSLVPEQRGQDYGQEAISTLLKRMDDDIVEKVCKRMSEIHVLPCDIKKKIITEFSSILFKKIGDTLNDEAQIKKLLSLAQGEDKAKETWDHAL